MKIHPKSPADIDSNYSIQMLPSEMYIEIAKYLLWPDVKSMRIVFREFPHLKDTDAYIASGIFPPRIIPIDPLYLCYSPRLVWKYISATNRPLKQLAEYIKTDPKYKLKFVKRYEPDRVTRGIFIGEPRQKIDTIGIPMSFNEQKYKFWQTKQHQRRQILPNNYVQHLKERSDQIMKRLLGDKVHINPGGM